MKKLSAIALVVTLASFMTAAGVWAFGVDVTSNFGVLVSEKGVCEQVGATTLEPLVAGDLWTAGTVITVELLANATICSAIDPDAEGNRGDYAVSAVVGAGRFTITILADTGGPIVFGDEFTPLCFNLENTPYNPNDPNLQLVQVSYRDNAVPANTYSGDTFVATVKAQEHTIRTCSKDERFAAGIGGIIDTKTGIPIIPLCTEAGQSQEVGGCGETAGVICITLTDSGGQFSNALYNFVLATDKPGVGIATLQAWWVNPATDLFETLATTIVARKDRDGNDVEGVECEDNADVAEVEAEVQVLGPGNVYLQVSIAYVTPTATPGSLLMDVAFNRIPCGDSFSAENLKVADLVVCGGDVSASSLLFPYSTAVGPGGFWVGFALTNLSDTEVSVTLVAYEEDGDRYDGSVTIGPFEIYAVPAQNLPLTTLSEDAAWADERFWINAFGTGPIDGLLFFGDNMQGMGYLPRTSGLF